MNVSDFLTSFFSIHCSGLKPRTSPAILQAKSAVSNFVMRSTPDLPSRMPRQVGSLPMPSGEIIPIPVTTTRRFCMRLWGRARCGTGSRPVPTDLRCFRAFLDVVDGVLDLADLLRLVVRDLHAELFLEGHDQLDGVERVGAEVFDERRFGSDLVRVDAQLLDDD